MIKPFFDEQSNIFTDVQFLKVDVDELSDVAAEANIKAMYVFNKNILFTFKLNV